MLMNRSDYLHVKKQVCRSRLFQVLFKVTWKEQNAAIIREAAALTDSFL